MARKTPSHWTGLLAILACSLLIMGVYYVRRPPLKVTPPALAQESLRVALPTVPHAALMHLAVIKGYMAEEGLQVSILPTRIGKEAVDLLVAGKADVAVDADVPFVIAVMNGQALSMVASILNVSTELAIVARRDRGILTPQNLAGKRIGVSLRTENEYFLWAFLIKYKLPPSAIKLVNLAPDKIPQELSKGTIDAAASRQPIVAYAQAALGSNALTFTESDVYTKTQLVLSRRNFLADHPATMHKLLRALLKAEQFARTEPEQSISLVSDWLQVDEPTLKQIWSHLDFRVELLQSQLILLEEQARWAMARGYAPPGPLPDFQPNLYIDALLAVRPERLTVVH